MYPPHHLGGYETTCWSSVQMLSGRGDDVVVMSSDFRVAEPDRSLPEAATVRRDLQWYWKDHAFPRRSFRERLRLERQNLTTLGQALDQLRPQAVAWWAMGGMSMSMVELVHRRGIPAVGVVGDEWPGYGRKVDAWQHTFGRPWLAWVAERATGVPTRLQLDRAARWIFISAMTRSAAVEAGWDVARSEIAHIGVDAARFPASELIEWAGRLLYAGRIDPRKGIDTAVRALRLLDDCSLTIDGGGDEGHLEQLRQTVAELDLEGRVTFQNSRREELPGVYAAADAVLFPVTWNEPWGLVPLEAMSVGRPVVATGTGGSSEYLRDGENCLIFSPPGDPQALAAAVRRLADDPVLRHTVREGGLRTADRLSLTAFEDAVARALDEAASAAADGSD
jgi:glycosyltransferase involved in cell wall biosynthesis